MTILKFRCVAFAIAATMLTSSLAVAQEQDQEQQDPAFQIVKLTNTREAFQRAIAVSMEPSLKQVEESGKATQQQIQKIRKAVIQYADEIYDDPDYVQSFAAIYRKEFTNDELQQLLDFYRTPLGKKTLDKMPLLFQQGAEIGQRLGRKYQPGFARAVQAIMAGTDANSEQVPDNQKQ